MKKKLIILTFFIYAFQAVFTVRAPLYIIDLGLSDIITGVLISVPYISALLFQLSLGLFIDKRKHLAEVAAGFCVVCAVFTMLLSATNNTALFSVFFIITSLSWLPLLPLTDALSVRSGSYGKIRLWGTLGFSFMSAALGAVSRERSSEIFVYGAYALLVGALMLLAMSDSLDFRQSAEKSAFKISELKDFSLIIIYCVAVLQNITVSFQGSYFGAYFTNELGYSSLMLGVVSMLRYCLEIPFYIFSEKIYLRLGVKKMVLFSLVATAVRMIAVGMFRDLWVIIAVTGLTGASYSPLLYCMVKYGIEVTGDKSVGLQAVNNIITNFPRICGALFGAAAVSAFGYGGVSVFSGALLGVCALTVSFISFDKKKKSVK